MESLITLKARLADLENQLERITIRETHTTPWAGGVQDQFKTDTYEYKEYTNPELARTLKYQIESLKSQISNYALNAERERKRQEELIESRIPKYDYESAGEKKQTNNPAIAARYDAQQRLFGMNKLQKTLITITGQKKKFERLWLKAATNNKMEQAEVAQQLTRLFR